MRPKFVFLFVILAAIGIFAMACGGAATPTAVPTPVAITEAIITAKGEVVPEHFSRVAFNVGGTVAQIPVAEGQEIKKGNTLAILDTSDLQLQVQSAQEALALAEATLTQAKVPASAEEVAASQAAYDSALAGLDRAKKGPTAQEMAAAQAAYDSAVAALNRAQEGPTPTDLAAAQSAYNSALTAYNRAKNGPTQEELQILQSTLAKAKAALDVAQSAYDRIGGASNPFSAQTPQALQLQQATQDYQIAISNYNKAVNPDPSTVAQAQSALAQANANLQKLKDSPNASEIAQAEAAVAQANSTLQKLKDSPNDEDVAQAQAQVNSAKAQLDLKKKGARAEDLRVAEIRVEQAKTGLDQAKAALAKATLVAPMDGTITDIAIREGELAGAGQPVFTIADLSNLKIETTDLDEFGAAKVQLNQLANIRVNAFADKTLTGKVTDIADQSVLLASGDVSYPVTIVLDSQDPDLRWGMTVKVEFVE